MYRITEVTDYKGSLPRHWYMGHEVRLVNLWIDGFKVYPIAFDVQVAGEEEAPDLFGECSICGENVVLPNEWVNICPNCMFFGSLK